MTIDPGWPADVQVDRIADAIYDESQARDACQVAVNNLHLDLFQLSVEWSLVDDNGKRRVQDARVAAIRELRIVEQELNERLHRLRQLGKRQVELRVGGTAHSISNDGL